MLFESFFLYRAFVFFFFLYRNTTVVLFLNNTIQWISLLLFLGFSANVCDHLRVLLLLRRAFYVGNDVEWFGMKHARALFSSPPMLINKAKSYSYEFYAGTHTLPLSLSLSLPLLANYAPLSLSSIVSH